MHASLSEVVPDSNVWTITIQDVTRGESFSQTVPYPSTHATAEWIEETPLEIGTNAGFASLPNLSNPGWTSATVNGASAGLKVIRGDGSHRLERQRDRRPIGAELDGRRIQRVHLGVDLQLAGS